MCVVVAYLQPMVSRGNIRKKSRFGNAIALAEDLITRIIPACDYYFFTFYLGFFMHKMGSAALLGLALMASGCDSSDSEENNYSCSPSVHHGKDASTCTSSEKVISLSLNGEESNDHEEKALRKPIADALEVITGKKSSGTGTQAATSASGGLPQSMETIDISAWEQKAQGGTKVSTQQGIPAQLEVIKEKSASTPTGIDQASATAGGQKGPHPTALEPQQLIKAIAYVPPEAKGPQQFPDADSGSDSDAAPQSVVIDGMNRNIPLDPSQPFPWEISDDDADYQEVNEIQLDIVVKKGDTFLDILASRDISSNFYYGLSKKQQKKLRSFGIGDELTLKETGGVITYFSRKISTLKKLVFERVGDDYVMSEVIANPVDVKKQYSFTINRSLYLDGKAAGLSDNVIMTLQDIYGEKFNFSRDARKGDVLSVVVNEPSYEGQLVGTPEVYGASIRQASGEPIYALRFEAPEGHVRYYGKDGGSLQTGFMRFPVQYTRISSNFAPRRKHPVLGYTRPHLGTDLAAPRGRPIYATSDGKVVRAGWASGYGNVVYINHEHGIQTRYGHMNKIATRRGTRVKRGELIGYVGMTGTATGYHCHYEYRINGKAVDAMKVTLPPSDPVPSKLMAEFKAQTAKTIAALNTAKNQVIASR